MAVFIAAAVIDYWSIQGLVQAQSNRLAQRLIAIELQNLLSLATTAETGQRGFIITGREEYLEPFYQARQKIPASISMLRSNLSRDPGQLQRLQQIEDLQSMKLAELEETIQVRRESGFEAAQAIVLTNRGKAIMDELRQHAFEMEQIERAKLNAHIQQSQLSAQQAFNSIIIAGVLDVALLLLLFLLVRADARRREAAARELANAETVLRNVIDSSPALIYLSDVSGRLLMVNKTYEKVFGIEPSQPSVIIDPNTFNQSDAVGPSAVDQQVMQHGETIQFEEEIEASEGKRYFFVSKAPLCNHEGLIVGICAVAADVTPLKAAEAQVRLLNQTLEKRVEERTGQLAQVNAQLHDANDQLEAFSYTVAHDLRAPLRGIEGFADAVVENYADVLDQVGRDYLHRVSRAAARMEQLIEDLLSFSRLSRMELSLGAVSLDDVLGEVMTNLSSQIQETGTKVIIASDLYYVRANRAACVHIFQNLLSNAIKFAKPGTASSVHVGAEIRQVEQGAAEFVRVWVEDTGIGIPKTQLQRIFKPFERLHGIDEYSGSGIGLAIVDKAIRRMNGTCGVESTVGSGSRFWVELLAVNMET